MRLLKDRCFRYFDKLTKKIIKENENQIAKWGIQRRTPAEWLMFATEEIGELAQAIAEYEYRQGTRKQVVMEAIQTATLCLKIAEMYITFWEDQELQ